VRRHWLVLLGPLLRYSYGREAFVLRGVGRYIGPVLREERRHAGRDVHRGAVNGSERRRARVA
jgi:hypothetical protein